MRLVAATSTGSECAANFVAEFGSRATVAATKCNRYRCRVECPHRWRKVLSAGALRATHALGEGNIGLLLRPRLGRQSSSNIHRSHLIALILGKRHRYDIGILVVP